MKNHSHHNNIRNVLQNTKRTAWAIQNRRDGMLTYSVVLLHDTAHPLRAKFLNYPS
jgi:hypothetical protein